MSAIKKLSPGVINKIAAGEVIENPASIAKELIENSLDACADSISINIVKAGLEKITIIDNGSGITARDVALAFERYSTSKLAAFEDLQFLSSLGFRGEALASIAAVAEVILQSRTEQEEQGVRIKVVAGKQGSIEAVARQIGTDITVSQLFFNTPVRRKFLKSTSVELRKITQLITTYALAYFHVAWQYSIDGKIKYQLPLKQSLQERIAQIFGNEIVTDLIPIEVQRSFLTLEDEEIKIKLTGFIGKPKLSRTTRQMQYLFVNQRPVGDFLVSYKIKESYGTLLDKQSHPIYFLFLEIPAKYIDVNIHPRKTEVKFQSLVPVYQFIRESIESILQRADVTPVMNSEVVTPYAKKIYSREKEKTTKLPKQTQLQQPEQRALFVATLKPKSIVEPVALAQILDTYLIARDEEGVVLVDQHAAAERILYEEFSAFVKQNNLTVQELLVPEVIEVSLAEKQVILEHQGVFKTLGFVLEEFGKQQFVIRAVPTFLIRYDIKKAVSAMIDQLLVLEKLSGNHQQLEQIIQRACKASIKAHDVLNPEEMQQLLTRLYRCEQRFTCPHGRPTMVRLNQLTLEKIFQRR